MMTKIFVFTAGNPEARQHLADSIEEPIGGQSEPWEGLVASYWLRSPC